MNRALVIIPTYNEVDNIERIIKRIFLEESFDVLVVDDSSPDGTADRVIELTPHFKNRLFLEGNHKKRGIGKAYLIGFEWALKRKYWLCLYLSGKSGNHALGPPVHWV